MTWKHWAGGLALALAAMTAFAPVAFAQEEPAATTPAEEPSPPAEAEAAPAEGAAATEEVVVEEEAPVYAVKNDVDILWTCLAAFLVFFMQAGFALVECGFTRAKNACNIMMKNLMDFALGAPLYWLIGFSLMFGATSGWFAWGGGAVDFVWSGQTDNNFNWAFLIFQTVFAATAATIVSGAMAERTKFTAYLVYTVFISAIIYPVFGSWAWNGLIDLGADKGWLEGAEGGPIAMMGLPAFYDFAGSTVVHSIGGWCALAGAIVVGARIGKYGKDGRTNPIPGHSIPMGALGVFVLWLGWFGFNPGSTTLIDGGNFAYIAVTTNLAGCTGAVAAMIASWVCFKKPDPSFSLNGALAGLVAITAGCSAVSPFSAAIIGLIAGVLVVGSVVLLDKVRVDDPVGAVSVHLVCGAFGTLATGLFMSDLKGPSLGLLYGGPAGQTLSQLIGIAAAGLWAFPAAMILFLALKYTIGLRVTQQEEIEGLDIGEHGMYAYPPALVADGMPHGAPTGHAMGYAAPSASPVGSHT